MKKQYLFLLFSIGLFSSAMAQTTLQGNVVSKTDGMPIQGVTIIPNNETENGVATDFDGNFTLEVSQTEGVISLSSIGFKTIELSYSGNQTFQITLEDESTGLDEVVLIGYGSSRKGDITSAIGVVDNIESITSRPVANLNDFLQGNVAGVTVLQQGGDPTASSRIVIRGVGSVNSETPLTVVDGVPYYGPAINPNDIASVSVLKDASAASIYGAQAASGVIVIQTKKGKIGKPVISLDLYSGFRNATSLPTALNAKQQADTYNTAAINAGVAGQSAHDASQNPWGQVTRTNWIDEIFRSAEISSINLNVSGATEKANYMSSFGYNKTDGLLVGTGSERFSYRVKSDFDLTDKLTVGENVYFSRTEAIGTNTTSRTSGSIISAIYMPSAAPAYDADGNFHGTVTPDLIQFAGAYGDVINPLRSLLGNTKSNPTDYINANVYLEYDIIDGLKFKTTYSYSITDSRFKEFSPKRTEIGKPRVSNSLTERFRKTNRWVWDNQVSYDKSFGNHNLNLTGVYSSQKSRFDEYEQQGEGFSSEEPFNQFMANATIFDIPETVVWEDALTSAIGRVMYNYDNKYFATGSVRRDQTSRLAPGHQDDVFYAASGAWRISDENFFNVEFIDDLKFRASWGEIGNINTVGFYSFDLPLSSSQTVIIGEAGDLVGSIRASGASNPELLWERSESLDFGLDATLFSNKLSLTFDYFQKTTKGMILRGLEDRVQGTPAAFVNGGEVENIGFEFSASYSDAIGDLNYTISANGFTLDNKLINLDGYSNSTTDFVDHSDAVDALRPYRSIAGQALFSNFLVPNLGIFQSQAEIDAHSLNGAPIQPNAVPGDLIFEDTNGDGRINSDDKVFMGSYQPDLTYNFGLNLDYKGFDLSMIVQGVSGVEVFNGYKYNTYNASLQGFNLDNAVLNAWTPTNTNTNIPRVSTQDSNNNFGTTSSWYLENASYLRFKNVTIGYSFPGNLIKGVSSLRIYASGENLFTITDYTGLDPEVGGKGLDNAKYPLARTISMGLSLKL